MKRPTLLVDYCSYPAAKYAVEHWHYSGCMPTGKTVKCGVWEDGQYVGCVIFSRGATGNLGKSYGLMQTEICELTRVALQEHRAPVSQIVTYAIKLLRQSSPGIRLLVSYADPAQDHYGGIYQAMNWVYVGTKQTHVFRVCGELVHPKTLHSRYGYGGQSMAFLKSIDPLAERVTEGMLKHKYLYPMDRAMRRQIMPLAQPYPKPASD